MCLILNIWLFIQDLRYRIHKANTHSSKTSQFSVGEDAGKKGPSYTVGGNVN
jgi:hypothetical protein